MAWSSSPFKTMASPFLSSNSFCLYPHLSTHYSLLQKLLAKSSAPGIVLVNIRRVREGNLTSRSLYSARMQGPLWWHECSRSAIIIRTTTSPVWLLSSQFLGPRNLILWYHFINRILLIKNINDKLNLTPIWLEIAIFHSMTSCSNPEVILRLFIGRDLCWSLPSWQLYSSVMGKEKLWYLREVQIGTNTLWKKN